jgi:hypothetical protein
MGLFAGLERSLVPATSSHLSCSCHSGVDGQGSGLSEGCHPDGLKKSSRNGEEGSPCLIALKGIAILLIIKGIAILI